jgi:hypothetical protein
MLSDRRLIGRTTVVQPAKIVVDAGATYDCVVDNLNTLGACVSLKAGNTGSLSNNFNLTFDNCHTFWSCRVMWRSQNGGRIGVAWKS